MIVIFLLKWMYPLSEVEKRRNLILPHMTRSLDFEVIFQWVPSWEASYLEHKKPQN